MHSYCQSNEKRIEEKVLLKTIYDDVVWKNLVKYSKEGKVVLWKNEALSDSILSTNEYSNLILMSEGNLYGSDIQYFLVVDEVSVKTSKAIVRLHTSSRYNQENFEYIRVSASFVLTLDDWSMEKCKITKIECCDW
jgi:hypothetical protein